MSIKDWKFTTKEGLVLDEYTDYPPDIKDMAIEMDMPDNPLSYAKVSIYHEDLNEVVFHIRDTELSLPTEHILTFNPFIRVVSDGMASGEDATGDLFYLLEGVEHELKKKFTHKKQGLKIIQLLQKLNMD